MFYVIETCWVWFVVAVIAGVAVGYWTTSTKDPLLHGFGWLRWVFIAFVVGVIVAIFGQLPDRAGFYLETLLGVVFSYVVGSLVGSLLRKAWSYLEATTAASAVRASGAPASTIDEAPPVRTGAAAVHSDVENIKVTEEARRAADAKAAEEAPRAADAKAAEEAPQAADAKAAEEARRAADAKAGEEARQAADAKAAEETRQAGDVKASEEERQAADAKPTEATRRVVTTKVAGETRRPADSKSAAQTRRATSGKNGRRVADAKAAEETRRAVHAKAAEEVRRAADAEAAEEARRAAAEAARQAVHAQAAKEVYRAADAEAAAEARRAADAKAALGRRLADTTVAKETSRTTNTKPAEAPRPAARSPEPIRPASANAAQVPPVASVGPSKPVGFASPLNDKADNLKLIKGIGIQNEKICNDLGIFHFAQIADWSSDEAAWVGHHMAFPGRVEREHWIAQARLLASGGDTEHSTGVKAGTIALDERADAPLDEAQTATLRESLPAQAEAVENETRHAGRRPYGLRAPRGNQRDNLKRIRGIGPQNETRLNGIGIWHYGQIAAWSTENIKWISSYLAVSGRIEREKWVDQAKELAAGRDTEFSRRTATRKNAAAKTDPAHGRNNPQVVEPYKEG